MMGYEYVDCDDGDYVVLIAWTADEFTIHQAWLIPGTQVED